MSFYSEKIPPGFVPMTKTREKRTSFTAAKTGPILSPLKRPPRRGEETRTTITPVLLSSCLGNPAFPDPPGACMAWPGLTPPVKRLAS